MAIVKIENESGVEILTAEFSRVPCIGEHISFDYHDGAGGGHTETVKFVTWTIHKGTLAVDALVTIQDDGNDAEFARYIQSSV